MNPEESMKSIVHGTDFCHFAARNNRPFEENS